MAMVKMKVRRLMLLLLAGMVITGVFFAARSIKVTETRKAIGTRVTITVIVKNQPLAKKMIAGAFAEISRLELIYSDRLENSELSRINRSAYLKPMRVSDEMGATLDHAFYWYERSGSRFDITVGSLGRLWGFKGARISTPPGQAAIRQVTEHLGMDKIQWDPSSKTIRLGHADVQLDVGGIAKLEILRKLRDYFQAAGQYKYLVNLGGDVLTGQRGELVKWKVGISDPDDPTAIITRLELEDSLVLTSGDYFRHYEVEGRRFHHILDAKSGYPVRTINAATLVMPANYPDPMPSIVVFLLGPEAALDMIETLPMVEGLIYSEGQLARSTGFGRLEVE
ncbi:FAD:protein FMN transferase [bacterium]|nr:FAD:protein FMN transferase [bacterium]